MSNKKSEITGIIDIEIFIDNFLKKVEEDTMLTILLETYLKGQHKIKREKIYAFWNLLLFGKGGLNAKPFKHNPKVYLNSKQFEVLLNYFYDSIDSDYQGFKADLAKNRAKAIANLFQTKMNNQ